MFRALICPELFVPPPHPHNWKGPWLPRHLLSRESKGLADTQGRQTIELVRARLACVLAFHTIGGKMIQWEEVELIDSVGVGPLTAVAGMGCRA